MGAVSVTLWLIVIAVLVFLVFPLVVVIPESFSPTAVLQFPPASLSLRWYRDFFSDPDWLQSLWLSIKLGICVAILSTLLGLSTAVAMVRFVTYGKGLLRALALSPLIVPAIVTAIALFDIMTKLDLVGSFWGLLLAHTIMALPFPVFILENALKSVDPNLGDAAVSLGANRFKAFYKVTVPQIRPAIFGAALFAFLASWDEVVIVLFVGGALLQTLPVQMFQFLTTEVRPTIASASTLLIAALLFGMLIMRLFGIRRSALRGRA
ncbi:MAG TPA: ABC transporter permease [Acetobacteraceae bacterium]|nr:ABC transporter permease [Acetobacteraceae bacterium]